MTSDLDVNVECNRGDFITSTFNKKFEEVWGATSADVFDTNIYAVR